MSSGQRSGWWWIRAAAWLALCALYLGFGVTWLTDEAWRLGEGPWVEHAPWLAAVPIELRRVATWAWLGLWLAWTPLVCVGYLRPRVWLIALLFNAAALSLLGWWWLLGAVVVLHAVAWEPGWLPPRRPREPEALFYDGECGLCHRWVRLVLAVDREGELFVFAPLQGEWVRGRIGRVERERLPDSIVVQRQDGALLTRSEAVVHVLERLGGWWRIAGAVVSWVPQRLRDGVYDVIARVRHRLFGAPAEVCPVVPAERRDRFRP